MMPGWADDFRRYQAVGFYSNALQAQRQHDFDLRLLDDLKAPLPELVDFTPSFAAWRRKSSSGRAHREEMASAVAIQRTMLPPARVATALRRRARPLCAYAAGADIGGDFYDYFSSR